MQKCLALSQQWPRSNFDADGAAQSEDNWVVDTLDKNGIKAFNNCKQALKDGGDGLADSKVLDNL